MFIDPMIVPATQENGLYNILIYVQYNSPFLV